ncbi:hypothetical protein GMYAFLOJ_CDS0070 [Microbacterium phage phiMiGM15]
MRVRRAGAGRRRRAPSGGGAAHGGPRARVRRDRHAPGLGGPPRRGSRARRRPAHHGRPELLLERHQARHHGIPALPSPGLSAGGSRARRPPGLPPSVRSLARKHSRA